MKPERVAKAADLADSFAYWAKCWTANPPNRSAVEELMLSHSKKLTRALADMRRGIGGKK